MDLALSCHLLLHINNIKFHYILNFHLENGCQKSICKLFTSLLNEGPSKNCHIQSVLYMTCDTIDNVTNIFNTLWLLLN